MHAHLKQSLIDEALAAEGPGTPATDIGFAAARVLSEDWKRLEAWLADGRHGEMRWLADRPGRRVTLSSETKTVIVTATAVAPLAWRPGEKRYASFAEAPDYHKAILARLGRLTSLIRAHGGRAKRLVDTGAVLERAWARESGLGFIGRNTMLISRSHGPFVMLGVILTDLALTPDAPGTGTCGACVRCLEVCPTQALDANGLDARRCISYLTIELKRPMTAEETRMCGDWAFGCDECVTICPYTVRGLPPVRPIARGATRYGK